MGARRIFGWTASAVASVRGRLTILATTLLALALALAAAILLFVLYQTLLNAADAATSARAHEVATTIEDDGLVGLDESVLLPTENLDVIQVIDSSGRVVAASPGAPDSPLVSPLAADVNRTADGVTFPGRDTEYRVTAVGVATGSGDVTVVVGAAEGPIHRVLATVAILLCLVFPFLLLLLAVATYHLVGRTLRPVEQIRAQVAAITSSDLRKRVPVPGTRDEISTLATTMNDMLGGLEDARLQQLRFIGDASHELRSPLMTLVGLLDLSRTTRKSIDPDTVEDILLPEAKRLAQMVDDLLLLARSDEYGVSISTEDVDLDDIVNAEAARLEALTSLDVQVDITPLRVRGDADMLTRAVRNIADNAARHADAMVRFEMEIDDRSGRGLLRIIDDGSGIPDPDKATVFDRFVRLDTDRDRARGGSGLGLAIVDEIIGAHHGTVEITDTAGGGTTVTIALDIDRPDGDEPVAPNSI